MNRLGLLTTSLLNNREAVRTNRWAIEKMLDAGFGLATIYYGEVDPDKNDFTDGIQSFFYVDDQQRPE